MQTPIIIDLDQSLDHYPGELRLSLHEWHERLRFACSAASLRAFSRVLDARLPSRHGTVLFGSGDFHHLSWPLIERRAADGPFQVIVLDNHPDNMRFPFGVHCGSWVRRVAALKWISHVHVVGITSADIGRGHAWENSLLPLLRGRLSYWSSGVDTGWARRLGLARQFRAFESIDSLVETFVHEQADVSVPSYLSIDKDVFSDDLVHTNWDQGRMQLDHALALIAAMKSGIVGSDINGEVSVHRYQSVWKRWLSALDGQPTITPEQMVEWRVAHHALNRTLMDAIALQMPITVT